MRMFAFLIIVCLSSCKPSPAPEPLTETQSIVESASYIWSRLTDNAPWAKSYNYQMFVVKDTLWAFHPGGFWYTHDGLDWSQSSLKNVIDNQAFLDYILFKDAVYGLGYFKGNIEKHTFRPEIYRTTDMRNWTLLSKESNLPKRFFYHPYVFNNKIWILGGEDEKSSFADLYSSIDGVHWVMERDSLPFGKRSGNNIVQLKGKLFMIDSDVWSSMDGFNWQLETKAIAPEEKSFNPGQAVIYDDKIWLLGCNRNGEFKNEMFVSDDGKHWFGQEAPWTPRGGVAAAVFKDHIFMTGGKYGGLEENGKTTSFEYSNDLWTLGKK